MSNPHVRIIDLSDQQPQIRKQYTFAIELKDPYTNHSLSLDGDFVVNYFQNSLTKVDLEFLNVTILDPEGNKELLRPSIHEDGSCRFSVIPHLEGLYEVLVVYNGGHL